MKFLSALLGLIIALLALVFALSNQQSAVVSLWPFGVEVEAPLYIWTLGALTMGLLFGGFVVWLNMVRHRFAARRLGKDVVLLSDKVQELEVELENFRARAGAPLLSGSRWPMLGWRKMKWRFWKKS